MMQSVEVLRDGASAQYGSDAIAGVINVRLRNDSDGGEGGVTYGWRDTELRHARRAPFRRRHLVGAARLSPRSLRWRDIDRLGVERPAVRQHRLVTLAAEYKDQEHTERGGYDFRQQYPLVGGAFDPREATFDRFNAWYGEPELEQNTLFVNAEYEVGKRRQALRLGELPGSRRALGGLLPPRARRSQHHPDLSRRLPADHRARSHGSVRGGRRHLEARRVGHGHLAGLRPQRDGVHHREHAEPLARPDQQDAVRRRRLRLRPAGAERLRRAHVRDRPRLAAEHRDRRRSAPRNLQHLRRRAGFLSQWRRACRTARRPRPARRCSRASGRRTRWTKTAPPSARTSTSKRTSRSKFLASVALRGESYSDFGENVSGKLSLRYDFTEQLRAARLGAERLPGAVAAAAVLRDHVDQLHQRRAVRHHDLPGHRSGRASRSARSRSMPRNR